MADIRDFMKSKSGLTFLALLVTLTLGIVIGSIVSPGVSGSGERTTGIQLLTLKGDGNPLVLDKEVSLAEGFSKVVKTIGPAVVNIRTEGFVQAARLGRGGGADSLREYFGDDFFNRFFDQPDQQQREQKVTSLGTGVIVDSKGYILTNFHVVSGAERISVKLQNGETYSAKVLGEDQASDLAVLRIEAPEPLPFAKVGDSTALNVGDWVLAIGSPFGLESTVTAGIVSATQRVVPTGIFGDYIQTDAAINPGNSGGPLVNMRGEVIGINSFISTRSGGSQGVGFAIPSTVFVNSYNQLVSNGKIQRGWLGVSMNTYPMTPEMAKFFGIDGHDKDGVKDGDGVIVTQLAAEDGHPADTGPAYTAGIRPEDVIVRFGGREIESVWDLRSAVANTPPGEKVPVVVVRKGEVKTLEVTLAERTFGLKTSDESKGIMLDDRKERERDKEIGIEVRTLSSRELDRMGIEEETGVLILSIVPGSLADEAELRPDQVITHVNGERVVSGQEFKDLVVGMPSGQGVILRVVSPPSGDQTKTVSFTSFVKP